MSSNPKNIGKTWTVDKPATRLSTRITPHPKSISPDTRSIETPFARCDRRWARIPACSTERNHRMQNFYEHRDNALGMTKSLCALLAACVICTIIVSSIALAAVAVASSYAYLSATTSIRMPFEHWRDIFFSRLLQAGLLTFGSVLGIAIYKSMQLAEGGGRFLAQSLRGNRVLDGDDDLNHRKAQNIVAEMAIASMQPMPTLYILEDEPGINAFAAGLDSKDTVIGVTRGAIDRLKRDQLQGIIAHEFSRIAHQDVRLNIRLLGIL